MLKRRNNNYGIEESKTVPITGKKYYSSDEYYEITNTNHRRYIENIETLLYTSPPVIKIPDFIIALDKK